MEKVKEVIEKLESEAFNERQRYFKNYPEANESIRNWTKGYIKGIDLCITLLKKLLKEL